MMQAMVNAMDAQTDAECSFATVSMSRPVRLAPPSPECGPEPVTTVPTQIAIIITAKVARASQTSRGSTAVVT